ncbi:MAG: helix-turn-helix domain-containing protein [Comamonadaceae bacterium]|uniref:helix-turn-helix domain-containing protein n=1 Tax=Hydrogenophaga sp. PML113 TaxID=1899350 RepID=UPI0011131BF0|nr:helix-turn-helix transcriptional regulator [Hydrogenophaga sp. PML113]NCT98719.1 helix-turn-helix domain-containing protein [Comamonadaceae bacterium]
MLVAVYNSISNNYSRDARLNCRYRIVMQSTHTTEELLLELGEQLRSQRLRMNLTLEDVAKDAGVSINVVRRLELGEGATLGSFVSVLRVLGRADWLATLKPPVTINPLDMLRQGAQRQRASKSHGVNRKS